MIKEKIKKKVGVKRWSIRCERLQSFLEETGAKVEDVKIISTGDFEYMHRCGRNEKYHWANIGCDSGPGWKSYVYVYVEKKLDVEAV